MILKNEIPYACAATELHPGTLAIRGPLTTDPVDDIDSSSYSAMRHWIEGLPEDAPVVLDIDSSGGDIAGLEAFCDAIINHKGPTTAFISGVAASAAYWIASSCDQITAAPSALIGSVGAMLPKAMEPIGETDVVATLSPRKNAADDQWQIITDAACERFLRHVASRRGWPQTDLQSVADKVGGGKMMTAQEAFDRGLIDRIEGKSMDPEQTPEVVPEGEKSVEDIIRDHDARIADIERRIEELRAVIDNLQREKADESADIEADREEAAACKERPKAADNRIAQLERAYSDIRRQQRDETVARLCAQGRIAQSDVDIAKIAWDHDRAAFDRRYGGVAEMTTVTRISSGEADSNPDSNDAVTMAYSIMAKNPGMKFREAITKARRSGGKL